MAFKLTEGFIDLTVRSGGFLKGMALVKSTLGSVNSAIARTARVARNIFLAASAAGAGFVVLAEKQLRAQLKLEAVLKTTGFAAGFSAKEIFALADEIQDLTGVSDALIISSTAILATFKKVRGEAFERTVRVAVDMAEIIGNVETNMVQLGKAIEDPITGLTALRRSGVSFTQAEKDMIKQLVEANKLMEAQSVVLDALEGQFQGAAEAAGKARTFDRIKNAFSDLGETIGKVLKPASDILSSDMIKNIENLDDRIQANSLTWGEWGAKAAAAIVLVKDLAMNLGGFFLDDFPTALKFTGDLIIRTFKGIGEAIKEVMVSPVIDAFHLGFLDMLESLAKAIPGVVGGELQIGAIEQRAALRRRQREEGSSSLEDVLNAFIGEFKGLEIPELLGADFDASIGKFQQTIDDINIKFERLRNETEKDIKNKQLAAAAEAAVEGTGKVGFAGLADAWKNFAQSQKADPNAVKTAQNTQDIKTEAKKQSLSLEELKSINKSIEAKLTPSVLGGLV
jgi:hypothetical protein